MNNTNTTLLFDIESLELIEPPSPPPHAPPDHAVSIPDITSAFLMTIFRKVTAEKFTESRQQYSIVKRKQVKLMYLVVTFNTPLPTDADKWLESCWQIELR